MGDPVTPEVDPAVFDANLAALASRQPDIAEELRTVSSPESLRPATGRDGTQTYTWEDSDGQLCWLGRTTMPGIRSVALVDTFRAGVGNVLLDGIGQGAEAALLLRRLARHQAVFVTEDEAFPVALTLRLHDFSDAILQGRLLLFTGESWWEALERFLVGHPGYLTPDRILAWPWFSAEDTAKVSERLAAVCGTATRMRVENRERQGGEAVGEKAVVVVSNIPDSAVIDMALRVESGADELGIPCIRCVLDGPSSVHPHAVEDRLRGVAPAVIVLVDVMPDALPFGLPKAGVAVCCTHSNALAESWLGRLPAEAHLGVQAFSQRTAAIETGIDESRVVVVPTAATSVPRQQNSRGRILVLAQGGDATAEAAGLHLGTHRHLWKAATEIVRDRCDSYHDGQALDVLRLAQRKLKIKLDDAGVEQGIAQRIRGLLGQVFVRKACLGALAAAGIGFDIRGGGWGNVQALASHDKGAWPDPSEVADCLAQYGLIVSIETSGRVPSALLDGIRAGIPAIVRANPADMTADGLSATLDPDSHVWRFESAADLVKLVRRFQQTPADFEDRARAAAEHVTANHTWRSRVQAILDAVQVD